MNDQQVIDLLFSDGFSSAEGVTETSGRGVGMSAIRKFASDMGGTVHLQNRVDSCGSLLVIDLPYFSEGHKGDEKGAAA